MVEKFNLYLRSKNIQDINIFNNLYYCIYAFDFYLM